MRTNWIHYSEKKKMKSKIGISVLIYVKLLCWVKLYSMAIKFSFRTLYNNIYAILFWHDMAGLKSRHWNCLVIVWFEKVDKVYRRHGLMCTLGQKFVCDIFASHKTSWRLIQRLCRRTVMDQLDHKWLIKCFSPSNLVDSREFLLISNQCASGPYNCNFGG